MKSIRIALLLFILSSSVLAGTTLDLSSPSNYNIRLDGATDADFAGNAVASGDINGDGIDDLVVGAYGTSRGVLQSVGSVYIVFGGASLSGNINLNAYYDVRFEGAADGDQLGSSVACGDINGDNLADIVMGAYSADNNGQDSGSVYVVFGSNTLSGTRILSTEADFDARFDGPVGGATFSLLGYAVSLGNVNNDTRLDLVLGAPQYGSGEAFLIFGPDTSFSTKVMTLSASANYDARFIGASDGDRFGSSIACGDVDQDNRADILIGAHKAGYNSRPSSGSVYLISGADTFTPEARSMANSSYYAARFDGANIDDELSANDELGKSLAVGDVNEDGKVELLMGAHKAISGAGSVYLVSGESTGERDLSESSDFIARFDGETPTLDADYRLGTAVAVRDLNSDNISDMLLGAAYADQNSRIDSGSVYTIFGTTEAFPTQVMTLSASAYYDLRFDGAAAGDKLGYSLATGDINHDDHEDPIMGAFTASNSGPNSGSVYVYTAVVQPAISSVTPSSKPQHWIGDIIINGTDFADGASVSFSDSTITVFRATYRSSTSLEARISISPNTPTGSKNITITNPNGVSGEGTGVFSVTTGGNGPDFSGITFTYNGTVVTYEGSTLTLPTESTIAGTITDSDGLTLSTVKFEIVVGTHESFASSFTDLTEATVTSGTFSYLVVMAQAANIVLYAEDVSGNPAQYTIPVTIAANPDNPIDDLIVGEDPDTGEIVIQATANEDVDGQLVAVSGNPTPLMVMNVKVRSVNALKAMGVKTGVNTWRVRPVNLLGEAWSKSIVVFVFHDGRRVYKKFKYPYVPGYR